MLIKPEQSNRRAEQQGTRGLHMRAHAKTINFFHGV